MAVLPPAENTANTGNVDEPDNLISIPDDAIENQVKLYFNTLQSVLVDTQTRFPNLTKDKPSPMKTRSKSRGDNMIGDKSNNKDHSPA